MVWRLRLQLRACFNFCFYLFRWLKQEQAELGTSLNLSSKFLFSLNSSDQAKIEHKDKKHIPEKISWNYITGSLD